MKKKLILTFVLALLITAFYTGCSGTFDLSQIKILPLNNPQLTLASLSQEVCPRCDSYSVLNGGKYVKMLLGGSISPQILYDDSSYSKTITATGEIQYCSNCGFMRVSGKTPTISLEDFLPASELNKIVIVKENSHVRYF